MLDLPTLDNLTRQADPASTDADLAARLSVPVKTPQDVRVPGYRVTAATLASVWGFARATTFQATLRGAIAAGQAADAAPQAKAFGAACDLALSVLTGPGLKCSDRESVAAAGQFVAVGFCTAAEVDGVFFDVSYPAGDVVTAADVTASRARNAAVDAAAAWSNATHDAIQRGQQWVASYANEYVATLTQGATITPFKDWLAAQVS